MKLHIPNSAFLGNIDPFLRQFDPTNPKSLEITANDKWISVHPLVLSMVAALGVTVPPESVQFQKLEAKSRHYLLHMGLFKILGIPSAMPDILEREPAGRFIPLTRITTSEELSRFITEMLPLLHLDAEPAKTIGYVVSELGRNVLEHADAKNGAFLCAQYYKKSNSIRVGIADTGVGIKATIGHAYPVKTDLDAIRWALQPGITGTTRRETGTEQNAGAGLFFIKSIASVNRDFFVVYSGNALFKLLKKTPTKRMRLNADPFDDRHSVEDNLPFWNGTAVGIDITLNPTEDFTNLLDAIRHTLTAAIKERVRARHKKPRYV